ETIAVNFSSVEACMTQVEVEYEQEDKELYILPLAFASGDRAEHVQKSSLASVLAEVTVKQKGEEKKGVIFDAIYDERFCKSLVEMIHRKRRLRGRHGEFVASSMRAIRDEVQ